MTPLLRSLAVSALALYTAPALAQSNLYQPAEIDWSDVTGSIASTQQPFFQLAPVPSVGSGTVVKSIQRLPTDARQLRFEGEVARRDLPVYLRKEQIVEQASLRLRFMNSIAVMPEASRMKVLVNDRLIGELALDAANDAGNVDLPIPPGLLEVGYNAISFQVQQRHRVDCSIEAANELWTQVDPAVTGIMVGSINDTVSQFEDLNALPANEDGTVAITVVLPQAGDNATIDQALRAAQALAIRAGLLKPKIAFTRDVTTAAPGIHLFVGTNAELRNRGVELVAFGDSAFTISGQTSGAARVAIGGATPNEIDQNIFRMVVEKPAKGDVGSVAGQRAVKQMRGFKVTSEKEISFNDAGIFSEEFSGRVYRAQMNIVMPPDFYPADNGKATLFLDASYVAGLATTNEALVRINNKVAGATRLRRSGGEDFNRRPIEMTLKALQPGFNTVTLEVRTATEDDKDCNPLSLIEPQKRLSVQNSTSFALPQLSRINHLPNLGATASTGFPFTEQKRPVALYIPKPDLPMLGAAGTILARQAIAAGRPFDTRLAQKAPDASHASALIVGAIGDLPADLVTYFGIKNDMLPSTWQKSSAAKPANAKDTPAPAPAQPAAFRFGAPTLAVPEPNAMPVVATDPAEANAETSDKDKIRWGKKVDERTFEERARQGLISFLSRNIGYTADQLSFLNGDKSAVTATRNTKLVFAQQQSKAGGNASWLLVTGPDAATIVSETTGLISQSSWNQLSGRMVGYDPAEADLTHWPDGQHYHYELRDWSFSNITLFAAGWLSNHIQYYVLVIIMMCGIFGVFTRKLLNRIGAQP